MANQKSKHIIYHDEVMHYIQACRPTRCQDGRVDTIDALVKSVKPIIDLVANANSII